MMSTKPLVIFVLVKVVVVPKAAIPLYICTLSPATAFVLVKDTRIVGVVSFVEPPLIKVPVIGARSSVTDVIVGALGAVVSIFGQALVVVVLPAASVAITVSSVEPVLLFSMVNASMAAALKV